MADQEFKKCGETQKFQIYRKLTKNGRLAMKKKYALEEKTVKREWQIRN